MPNIKPFFPSFQHVQYISVTAREKERALFDFGCLAWPAVRQQIFGQLVAKGKRKREGERERESRKERGEGVEHVAP